MIRTSLPGVLRWHLLIAGLWTVAAGAQAQEARINVQADRVLHRISRHLTGACIEDVNHEIYGGIYSQMIFGESFQEPATTHPEGFRAYGGDWRVEGGELVASGVPGDKLVSESPPFADGEAGVEVFVPDRNLRNAGLIVRVARPGRGMDNFDGYEVSLDAGAQRVVLGRHRHNWEHIRDIPCEIPIGRWVPLTVRLNGPTIEILVDGKSIGVHRDDQRALLSGQVGLRRFQPEARYRRFWVKETPDGEMRRHSYRAPPGDGREVSGMWRPVVAGTARGSFRIETQSSFLGRQSQRIELRAGEGLVGVENRGLNRWGLFFMGSEPYEGVVWARSEAPVELIARLESGDGTRQLAETSLPVAPGDWRRLAFTLTPAATAKDARFTLALRQPGSVVLGYAFLQPGDWGRLKGLPLRRDVVEGLIDQGITVLRYGGSMVNNPGYRWKNMIGPREKRPPYAGHWYPYSTNGWGILDFLDLCEAAGFLAIPAFNMGETPRDLADFVEYVNGPETSEWGRKRAADGHPAPYRLRHIELGNEERIDDDYVRKFQPLAESIWARDPEIIIVVGDFAYGRTIRDPRKIEGAASRITNLDAQRMILELAKQHDREVWFDLHVGTEGPRPDSTLAATLSFIDALEGMATGARFKVAVFELNAGNHSQRRALANALAINAFERDGRVPIVTSANCLQPDGQNDNDWNQGLLFLNPSQVWLQPPGYITRMFSEAYLPELAACQVIGADGALDVNAKRSADGKTLVIQAVNPTDRAVAARIHLDGFAPTKAAAKVTELSGPLDAVNTAAEPKRLTPSVREWTHGLPTQNSPYTFSPYSVTTLRFE